MAATSDVRVLLAMAAIPRQTRRLSGNYRGSGGLLHLLEQPPRILLRIH
jgi:hypothetical protein